MLETRLEELKQLSAASIVVQAPHARLILTYRWTCNVRYVAY